MLFKIVHDSFLASTKYLTAIFFLSIGFTKRELDAYFSAYDLKRLESYANNMLDYHVILDLLPTIAHLYFGGRLGEVIKFSGVQSSILLGIGLQRKAIEDLEVISARYVINPVYR